MPNTRRYKNNLSKKFYHKLINGPNKPVNLYNKKLTYKTKRAEVNVTWDFFKMRKDIMSKIPQRIYGWYHETTSSSGNSTFNAIDSFKKYTLVSNYLNKNKDVTLERNLTLHSAALGTSHFTCKAPFFTAPYGCASEYGGKSDEIKTMMGTMNGGGIYTLGCLSKYPVEYMTTLLKKRDPNAFFMYQLYLTGDDEINRSLIDRAKHCGTSVMMITIDTGSNNHGGIGLLEAQSDLTFERTFCGNVLEDPVFNIKCYREHGCVGTKTLSVLKIVATNTLTSVDTLRKSYKYAESFDYAKSVQGKGMGNVTDQKGHLSMRHIADLCHASTPVCKYTNRSIKCGIPIVVKGCLSVENAIQLQSSGVDGIYVSNHGGRFMFNSVAPLVVLPTIHTAVKRVNPNFGVWFDGGIRYGQDILTAYALGAEFVGIGRPIIYACVLYGETGVSSTTKKLLFELEGQCKMCGLNNLNDADQLRQCIR